MGGRHKRGDGPDLGLVGRQGLETGLLQRLDISMFIGGDGQNRDGQS